MLIPVTVYENPLLTADSRTLILYLYALTHKLSSLGVPRLRLSSFLPFLSHDHPKPFPLLHVWCEVIETCESESFDGARMAMLEQTLHILFLPEWHTSTGRPSSTNSLVHHPGDNTGLSSPFHFQLHVITRLQFNEGGRIAMHRDFWGVCRLSALTLRAKGAMIDVRDLTEALFSFSTLFGWFARRLIAYNLIAFAWIFSLVPSFPRRASTSVPPHSFSHSAIPTPRARTRTSTYTGAGGAVSPILRTTTSFTREQEGILSAGLGLSFGAGARNMQVGDGAGQAPDTDRDSMS
ncbi:hypothetical protein DACRYDRAFT_44494 [Dacryopinax primogenitus]|uniref:Uncharacterized protein n=1 Tax=Dacryopinax primogenitus (strain DJM 731) TaxID=1858805 RepID=M5GFQ1_DACPD|nr:uncharacterized protein DACRYDRAFT_44494 [Dacryopinax primogenitus]EJU06502.1 hypothetical protein DACRYDRAFT_44494 [Dacryopinax primogenitus]